MPKFSIITPSYNSWQFMSKYWTSLEQQIFQDFEVIVVDDCSQDGTFEKLKAYVKSSPLNIKLIQNSENHGPGYARNRGIKEATGEWLTFADSDDSVDIHLLEKAEAVISTNDRAAVPINCIVYDYNIVKGKEVSRASSMYGSHRGGVHPVSTCIAEVRNHVVGKFYKTDLVKKVSFPELKRCEDVAFVCRAIDACCMDEDVQIGCVYYLKEALYNYIQHSDSLSNDKNLDATDMVKAYDIINEKLGRKYPDEICSKSVPDLLYGGTLMMCKANKSNLQVKKYIADYEAKYPDWYKSDIINEVGRAKKVFLFCARYKWIGMLKALSRIHSKMVG